MTDPVQGAGKGVSEIAKKQMEGGVSESGPAAKNADGKTFDEILSEGDQVQGPGGADQVQDPQQVQKMDKVQETEMDKLDGMQQEGADLKIKELMNNMSADRQKLDGMMEQVMNGKNLDQKELLEMQGMIYQYSQKVELTSKVVEKGTGGLKKMLNMQV